MGGKAETRVKTAWGITSANATWKLRPNDLFIKTKFLMRFEIHAKNKSINLRLNYFGCASDCSGKDAQDFA